MVYQGGDANPPSILGMNNEMSRLCSIPDPQQGIRCKAPRSDEWRMEQSAAMRSEEGNTADDALRSERRLIRLTKGRLIG